MASAVPFFVRGDCYAILEQERLGCSCPKAADRDKRRVQRSNSTYLTAHNVPTTPDDVMRGLKLLLAPMDVRAASAGVEGLAMLHHRTRFYPIVHWAEAALILPLPIVALAIPLLLRERYCHAS